MRQLLCEKHRPTNTKDYIFPNAEAKARVEKWIKAGEIPNVLMVSGAGQGKTTLSNIIINELGVDPADVKSVNASLKNGIGFIREELEPWMQKAPMGDFKVVQLEEIDQISREGQGALRRITEEYSDYVRFIATANFESKISEPLHSRFQRVDMEGIEIDDIIDMVVGIVEEENIDTDEETLLVHIDKYAPDMRKIINSIEESTDADGKLMLPSNSTGSNGDIDEWRDVWEGDGELELEKIFELTELVDNTNFDFFYSVMAKNSHRFPDEVTGIIILSEYEYRAQNSANQRLHLDACLFRLFVVEEEE